MRCSVALQFALQPLLSLILATADGNLSVSKAVDLFNSATGAWTTAQLSVARTALAAASVGSVALFAGGAIYGSALMCKRGEGVDCLRVC